MSGWSGRLERVIRTNPSCDPNELSNVSVSLGEFGNETMGLLPNDAHRI